MQKTSLMHGITSNQKIGQSIENYTRNTQNHYGYGQMHGILMINVNQSLDGLHQQGEGQRGQYNADNQLGQDINTGPAEGISKLGLTSFAESNGFVAVVNRVV